MCATKAKKQARTAQPARSAAFAYPTLLPIKVAAQRLGLSKWTVRNMVYRKQITHYKISNLVMIAEEDIQRILAKSKVESVA